MNLDLILEQALDDFEDQSLLQKSSKLKEEGKVEPPKEGFGDGLLLHSKVEEQQRMNNMLQSLQDPTYGATLQSTLKSLSNSVEGIETVDDLFESLARQFEQQHKSSMYPESANDRSGIEISDREVATTMQLIGQAQQGMEGFNSAKIEGTAESMMEEMMSEFEELGEKKDYNEVVDGVMRQLLSKDLMYDPTKQICEKFPEWLSTHRRSLSEAEYNNYGKQYQSFQKILAVYDTEPDNYPRYSDVCLFFNSSNLTNFSCID